MSIISLEYLQKWKTIERVDHIITCQFLPALFLVLGPKPDVVLLAGAVCTLFPKRVLTLGGCVGASMDRIPCVLISEVVVVTSCFWTAVGHTKRITSDESWNCLLISFYLFYNYIVPLGFLSWKIWVAFPGESQLQQSCYPTYGACWVF